MPGALASATRFDADWLGARLAALRSAAGGAPSGLVVAWSGGADSTALLGALCELRAARASSPLPPLRALHVDHGLQPASRRWARHCREIAGRLRVTLQVRRVKIAPRAGESVEALARDARLEAFAAALRPGEWLLTAQHSRDQLETLLLQLLRGAGPAGLAAMPERRALGSGWLVRPLLDRNPAALRAWLEGRGLAWVEDPSNDDPRFDRNYLRARVLPAIEARWPAAAQSGVRSAALVAGMQRGERARAGRLLARVRDGDGLSLPLLRRLPEHDRFAVLRAWIESADESMPDRRRLHELASLATLREDAQPVVRWGRAEVRLHDQRLLLRRTRGAPQPSASVASACEWRWPASRVLDVPGGRIRVRDDARGDLDLDLLPATMQVRARGDRDPRDPDGRRVDVKCLLQESGVPAWERAALPFVHATDDAPAAGALLAIADLWIAPALRAGAQTRHRGRFVWQRAG